MTYSSRQVAQKLGIAIATLSNYIAKGKIPEPKSLTTGGITVHIWTHDDVEQLRKLLPKIANGRKTRYKKKQSAPTAGRGRPSSKQSRQARDRSAKAKGKTKSKKRK